MKKRLFSVVLACVISLAFAGSAFAAVIPPASRPTPPVSPNWPGFTPPAGHPAETPWTPGMNPWRPSEKLPNPLPKDASPLPAPGGTTPAPGVPYAPTVPFDKSMTADLHELVNKLATKYNADPKSVYKYMVITESSYSKLSEKDQKSLKSLMLKMAAKEMGISASKLESELKKLEDEWADKIVARTGMSRSQARSYLYEHARHSLFYHARRGDKKVRYQWNNHPGYPVR